LKKKKYKLNIQTGAGFYDLIQDLKKFSKKLEQGSKELLERLTQEGYEIASARFERAVYDGTNDVSVSIEERDNRTRAIVAIGSSTLFIEFGTGIKYGTPHPEADKQGMVRGAYGKGMGKYETWGYYGEAGSHGIITGKVKDGKNLILTHGNPANMPMYRAVKELKEKLPQLVREVFDD
jgi:hypothetical protein